MEILCFFAGVAFVYTKSLYSLLILFVSRYFKPTWSCFYWFALASMYTLSHQWYSADRGMPTTQVIAKASLEGTIVSIPSQKPDKTQFQFLADHLNDRAVQATILLSCYQNCPQVSAGERWQFEAKLKRPQNLANPGGFDFVSWLDARHIYWTGYLKKGTKLKEAKERRFSLLGLREKLALSLSQAMPSSPVLGILQALSLGVTTNIDKAQWDLFRRTGTTHLMVISGSHIALIAGFCYWLLRRLWTYSSRLCLYCPASQIASIASIAAGAIYALLTGFEAPAQRALLACIFVSTQHFFSFRLTVWQSWRYALFLVLLLEPHFVLQPGFYLSFIAVAIIILVNQRSQSQGLKKVLYLQLACLLGLMPLTLYWFSYGAINGLLANLLAIPLVEFAIVPWAIICLLVLQFFPFDALTIPVSFITEGLLLYLHWVDSFAAVNLSFTFTSLAFPLALMAAMFILLFLHLPRFFLATMVLVLAAFFPAYPRLKFGEVRVDILDVGQGLAVVLRTAQHSLVYDTGMKFFHGGDMAKLAIIPFLNTQGVRAIDKIVISHPDLDHRGGLASLEERYPVGELIVDKVSYYHRGKACHTYPSWQWDGVSFHFLALNKHFRNKNNSSCVLQIDNEIERILLTGDIEKAAEDYLVETYGEQLKAKLLLIPHHGSKTSSSPRFIRQVAPKYAVISAGFDNRYRFPHQQTLESLAKQKVIVYNTMHCGMTSLKLAPKQDFSVNCYKKVSG